MNALPTVWIAAGLFLMAEHLLNAHVIKSYENVDNGNQDNVSSAERLEGGGGADDLNEELVEKIKAEILQKLGLKEEPKNVSPKPALQNLNYSKAALNYNSYRTREIENEIKNLNLQSYAVFSEIDAGSVNSDEKASVRFRFNLSDDVEYAKQVSHELWIFKNNSLDSFNLSHYIHTVEDSDYLYGSFLIDDQQKNQGWIRFDISAVVRSVITTGRNILDLEISSSENFSESTVISTNPERKPFIIVHHYPNSNKHRSKRSVDCSDGESTCCRERLYISFESIGFDSWILEPEGYEANYCRGSCHNNIELIKYPHGNVLINFIKNNRSVAESLGVKISCVPSKMSGLPFIHLNANGIYVEKNLPNMVVETCECT